MESCGFMLDPINQSNIQDDWEYKFIGPLMSNNQADNTTMYFRRNKLRISAEWNQRITQIE